MLKQVGIVKSKSNIKSYDVFNESISDNFLEIPEMKSSEYVKYCWERYENFRQSNPQDNSMNGNIFELIIVSEMHRQGLYPMFLQAKVAFVPNVNFDVLLYSVDNFPIGISLKTSLRERYKQADLEATALKYVHRRAKNYLITLGTQEAKTTKEKLKNGEVLGLDDVIIATEKEFDALIGEFKKAEFIKPDKIEIVTGTVVTKR